MERIYVVSKTKYRIGKRDIYNSNLDENVLIFLYIVISTIRNELKYELDFILIHTDAYIRINKATSTHIYAVYIYYY